MVGPDSVCWLATNPRDLSDRIRAGNAAAFMERRKKLHFQSKLCGTTCHILNKNPVQTDQYGHLIDELIDHCVGFIIRTYLFCHCTEIG